MKRLVLSQAERDQQYADLIAEQRSDRVARGECWCCGQDVRYCVNERNRIVAQFHRGLGAQLVWTVSL